ncbi:MAG: type VI secretion system baseplate subunit TssE [Lacipirellulaceae bacterium]
MAELTPQERLQPSLLDRLTDDDPTKGVESIEHRVLSIARLHDCVLRDLSWLLNTEDLSAAHDLSDFPDAASSTINYGVPSLSGKVIGGIDVRELEDSIRACIERFEPRLLPGTVRVRSVNDDTGLRPQAMAFEIEASVWAQPLPLRLLVNAEVDLETGGIAVARKTS